LPGTLVLGSPGGEGLDRFMNSASGTFEVKVLPLVSPPAKGLMRMSVNKQVHGGLEATSTGEMISGGNLKAGFAGYVAMEMVTGKLDGKSGSFALQHVGTMDASGKNLQILVVPGSSRRCTERGGLASRSSKDHIRIGRPPCPENPRPKGGILDSGERPLSISRCTNTGSRRKTTAKLQEVMRRSETAVRSDFKLLLPF
jgi:Protein of unknown function (DUF3224)